MKLRDADCELKTFEIKEGTLAHETETNKCKTDLTKKRISLLLELRPKNNTHQNKPY
ncbi:MULTISPECIES: lysozyme inhibitor LprI family protein [Pseudomonas]|uniref:lysozyme inhibitor LprI family protein n=1 Tax=Pseudomonas TaxID=286 RepID=UPI00338E344D